jgi:hypothetical protein
MKRDAVFFIGGLIIMGCAGFAVGAAEPVSCVTSVRGEAFVLQYDPEDQLIGENYGWRERFFGPGGDIDCPAYVTLRQLTPGLRDGQRKPFCLRYDAEAGTYLGYDEGERSAYLACKTPGLSFCERVNGSAEVAAELVDRGVGLAERFSGIAAVAQQGSGAVILSGTGGQLAGALTNLGSTAMAVLTAPATLTAAAVTVVAVGGTLYVCH